MRYIKPLTALTGSILMWSCSSIPDKAPQEYHLADAAIHRAKAADADDPFPHTVDRAKDDLKEALSLYKQSQDKDVPEPTRQSLARAGSDKANSALHLAERATSLRNQVASWDERIEIKDDDERLSAELSSLREKIAMMDQAQVQAKNNALSADLNTPVVFFPTGKTEISDKYQDSLSGLANTLKANPQLRVTLTGYADKTGHAALNDKLAEERADSVASALKAKGVAVDQILIDSHGASQATASVGNKAGLQLDRRVDAFITSRSAADAMTTGR